MADWPGLRSWLIIMANEKTPAAPEYALKVPSDERVKAIAEDILKRNADAGLTATSNKLCLLTTIAVLQEAGALHPSLVDAPGRKRVRELLEKFSSLGSNASQFGKWLRPDTEGKKKGEIAD